MSTPDLQRFLDAQKNTFETALAEIRSGRKKSHWMWFVFPQIQGLGFSDTARYYAIQNLAEAEAYLHHPVLGNRLQQLCAELLNLSGNNATQIFGTPDDLKLKSSMTLFAAVPGASPLFQQVLDKFYAGAKDPKTEQQLSRLP